MKLLDPRGVSIEVSDEYGETLLESAGGYRRPGANKSSAPASADKKSRNPRKNEETDSKDSTED